jgi:SAM-dependent methyltransferase
MPLGFLRSLFRPAVRPAGPRLASVPELESAPYRTFMAEMNAFARSHGLREFTDWSKVWEYPWLWFHGMDRLDWRGRSVLDLGSEISPMPWWLAARGARVTLIETDAQWVPVWERLRRELGADVRWHIVSGETLPDAAATFDAATSLSVIEHQPDKPRALAELARVLRPGAPLFLSYDICEPDRGMTFPEWNGRALTMAEFERDFWRHPDFATPDAPVAWNTGDLDAFRQWHLRSAPHHNYCTGAAVLVKRR